jgi:hypothetical protein
VSTTAPMDGDGGSSVAIKQRRLGRSCPPYPCALFAARNTTDILTIL